MYLYILIHHLWFPSFVPVNSSYHPVSFPQLSTTLLLLIYFVLLLANKLFICYRSNNIITYKSFYTKFLWFSPEHMFVDFREIEEGDEKREGEGEREEQRTSISCPPRCQRGSNPQPGVCPDWKQLANFWCKGRCSNQLNHPARAPFIFKSV